MDKKKLAMADKVLLLFKDYDKVTKGLLCNIDEVYIKKDCFVPDSVKPLVTDLNKPSKVWLVLSEPIEVGYEYFNRCMLVHEGYMLGDRLDRKGDRFPRAYYREVE